MTKHDYSSRECATCHKPFIPKKLDGRHIGKYCSKQCFLEATKRKEKRKCAKCGAEFLFKKYDRTKYCSIKCFRESDSQRGENNHGWTGESQIRECSVCSKKFKARPWEKTITCSKKCGSKQAGRPRDTNPNWRGGKEVNCIVCNKPFWRVPSWNKIYCSNQCFYKGSFNNRNSGRFKTRWGYGSVKVGMREDLGIFVRSSWEANYARYLNWLKTTGNIVSWEYEPDTFEFEGIKRGTRFYTPDFKIKTPNESIEYHEVKGWMTPKSKTALDRMGRYWPQVKIVLIDKTVYKSIERQMKNAIPNWE